MALNDIVVTYLLRQSITLYKNLGGLEQNLGGLEPLSPIASAATGVLYGTTQQGRLLHLNDGANAPWKK